ncbi:MAG TPA: hypothetical protein VL400_14500, partial [Polyangiaceae bacterium]|nr:hypothetical protein [Polyangiaceae bacterium]
MRLLALCLGLLPAITPVAALAQPAAGGADAKPKAARPAKPRASAVSSLAEDLAASLPPQDGKVVVGVAPLESDAKATRPDALVTTIAGLVAGRRGWEAPT